LKPLVTYVYDLDQRHNTYVAGSLFQHLGFSLDAMDVLSSNFFALLTHPADRERIAAHHAALGSQPNDAVVEIEYRVKAASGEWRWLVSRDRPYNRDRDGRVTQILGVAEEIADRRSSDDGP